MIEAFVENAAHYLQSSSLLAYLAVYAGGVLVSFTPCTYPVAPLTVAFIGAHSSGSKLKGFVLSLVYVFGMALTYTAIGAAAALTGQLFGQIQSNPWMFFLMANVCLLMGLSMLDAFALPIRTPRFVARLQPGKRQGGPSARSWSAPPRDSSWDPAPPLSWPSCWASPPPDRAFPTPCRCCLSSPSAWAPS